MKSSSLNATLSKSRKSSKQDFIDVRRLLLGYELNGTSIGQAIGKSPNTGKDRLEHPEHITLGELKLICRNKGIPADEIRRVIKFDY